MKWSLLFRKSQSQFSDLELILDQHKWSFQTFTLNISYTLLSQNLWNITRRLIIKMIIKSHKSPKHKPVSYRKINGVLSRKSFLHKSSDIIHVQSTLHLHNPFCHSGCEASSLQNPTYFCDTFFLNLCKNRRSNTKW